MTEHSFFTKSLFLFLFLAAICAGSSGITGVDTGDKNAFHLKVRLGGGYRLLSPPFDLYSDGCSYYGGSLDLPTHSKYIVTRTSADIGIMPVENSDVSHLFIRGGFSLLLDPFPNLFYGVRPSIGISNTMIYPTHKASLEKDPFATSESEFGARLGAEAHIRLGRYELIVPLESEIVFSSPEKLMYWSLGLYFGGAF
jgi:hypothetical protein